MSTDTDIDADLSDLELLDDSRRHGRCLGCTPDVRLGVPFIAWCGRRVVWLEPRYELGPGDIPADACHACMQAPVCAAGIHHS